MVHGAFRAPVRLRRFDMMFVKYVGSGREGAVLRKGRVYLGRPALEDHAAVDVDKVVVVGDDGSEVSFRPADSEGSFEFLDFVYAVVLRDCGVGAAGDVVRLEGADDDGYYLVAGKGHHNAAFFEIMDESNLAPGFWVLDLSDGRWRQITRVAACGWVAIEGLSSMRPLTDFAFPVGGGGVLAEPVARCVDVAGEPGLEEGRVYRMTGWDRVGGIVEIVVDDVERSFMESRFEIGDV